ncbi:MAG: UvrD-helicase domain-containing protein [Acidobacteriota bacterium]
MTPHLVSDAAARERIRNSLDESLIVEASAGTGKTTELVRRIVAVLEKGKATIGEIAAVTFTNKASGELKLRLRQALDKARYASQTGRERERLEDALEHLEEASIGTIHSFCAQILRERPVEAQVDPAFEELSEQEANRLYQRAFRAWLEQRLNQNSPGLKRAFARLAARDSWDDGPPIEQLQYAGRKLVEWRDYPAAWRREPFAREEEIRTLLRKTRELADASSRPRRVTDNLYRGLQPARLLIQSIDRPEVAGAAPDADVQEAQILKLARDLRRDTKKGSGEYGGGVTREHLAASRDELMLWIEDFRRRADADLAACLRDEMSGIVEEYNERKRRQGKLDFVDLLIYARDLVRDQPVVREYLQRRFKRLFVDEFQDTDPLQVEIIRLLAADSEPGKLFLVGDPKQSIYKFRRADIDLYKTVCDELLAQGVGLVRLTRSFRSVPNIQNFVNAAFETEMSGDGHAEYSPLQQDRPEIPGRPSVIALPVPKPYKMRLSKEAVNKSLPDAIAAFIAWLVNESGWGYAARDIAVLFRRRTQAGQDLTREYARALEARGVEHLLAGSKSFHHREEVETVRAALTAVEWPDDELSVFATLKGSLFAVPDETLFLHKHKLGRLNPLYAENAEPPLGDALSLLGRLHRNRNRQPFAATVNELLTSTRAHAGFLLRPGGSQILANVARVADLARTFEMTGGVSFRAFVEELNAQAEKEEAAEAPVLEEDSDGVRLMTVHGAKGLEFPVVILADLTANIAARDPDQYVDGEQRLCATRLLRCAPWELLDHENDESIRERAEGVRVAYVAATRARDLLVVPAVGDEPFPIDGWLSPLDKALYPARDAWRESEPAEGCPKFGQASILDRPRDYDQMPEASVRPGLIKPQQGDHQVVWWDPRQLQLGAESDYGLRQEEVLKEDGGVSLAAYQAWRDARTAAIQAGSRAECEVFLASHATTDPPGPPLAVGYVATERVARPGGRRFGTLVHAVLRDVALDASAPLIRRVTELNARILGATNEEVEAARKAVETALAHPLIARARAASRSHREYPITLALEDNRWMEGVIDLAFVENDGWVIVDFKTDADAGERRLQYERQLAWYAYALTLLTGLPAHATLFSV